MLISIITRTLNPSFVPQKKYENLFAKLKSLIDASIVSADWTVYPDDCPTIVSCTFSEMTKSRKKPIFTFALAPELKPNLADYFSHTLSLRLNTEYEEGIKTVYADTYSILNKLTRTQR